MAEYVESIGRRKTLRRRCVCTRARGEIVVNESRWPSTGRDLDKMILRQPWR